MKAPKEIKQWFSRLRRRFGKRNGVIKNYLFDCPEFETKSANNKRLAKPRKWKPER